MDGFNKVLTNTFDIMLYPFDGVSAMWPISTIGMFVGIALVWAFGKVSNQERLRRLKTKIKGHLLEIWIFRQNSRAVFLAQYRVLSNAVKYTAQCIPAFALFMIPVALVMIQLQVRYGYTPLQPGRSAIVRITYAATRSLDAMNARLEVPAGVTVETPRLRIPTRREVDYRIRPKDAGVYTLVVRDGENSTSKSLHVGKVHTAISPYRSRSLWTRFLYPVEGKIKPESIASIEIVYPRNEVSLLGLKLHWLWPFFIITILAGLAAKRILRIEL